jgi:hypothetical protein
VWIELDDELFPPRNALIGLQFSSPADFARAQQLVAADLSVYREAYPYWSTLVVRRTDIGRFASTGLHYTEVEQIDDEDLSPAEVARRDRELIDAWKPILLKRLSS